MTPAEAQAELDRRAAGGGAKPTGGITAGQAQAELERRRSAGSENQPGVLQQLFDIKNSNTGESYLYGNTPPPAPYEDLERTVADTVSRGYLDKLRGPEAQAKTQAARERMPGWVETPTDIGAAVASSPYRIGSMGVGALAGAAEGAASAYGHQDNWIPDAQGWWDIAKGTGLGTVAGAGSAKVGEWLGGRSATKAAEEAKPYKTQADINAAGGAEAADRAAVSAAAEAAQGSPRDDLARMLSGMNLTPEVEAKIAEIAAAKSGTRTAGAIANRTGKEFSIPLLVAESVASGGIPYKTLMGMGAKHLVSKAGQSASKVSEKEAAALADVARNGELNIDPAIIDRWRDAAAKAGIGYGREP